MDINAGNLALLSQAVDMRFRAGLQRAATPWNTVAMEIPSSTGRNLYPYFKDLGSIRKWIGDRVVQNVSQGDFIIPNEPFERTNGIEREHIEDDSYGMYGPIFEQTGLDVARFPSQQVYSMLKQGFSTLGPDGQYFFDTDHPVGSGVARNFMGGTGTPWFVVDASQVFKPIIWQPRKAFNLVKLFNETDPTVFFNKKFIWGVDGRSGTGFSPFWQLAFASRQTLDATALRALMTEMGDQVGENGAPLQVEPTHLFVPPSLYETAFDLMNRSTIDGTTNTLKGRLEVVKIAELR